MKKLFIELYTTLVRLRLVEEYIAREYPNQAMRCPMHLCLGQEAVAVGAVHTLQTDDVLFGTHRSHGPYIASHASIEAMLLEMYGKEGGCCQGRGGSMHLRSNDTPFWGAIPIVGSALAIATGTALAHKMKKSQQVSMVLFGEGATEEGIFYESLQFAVLKQLPIVYVCENNGFSVNTPYEQRRPKHIKVHELVKAQGLQVFTGDGNNVFDVYNQCLEAVALTRSGAGPVFLEFETYRYMEHCGPHDDHHLPARSEAALTAWKLRDPLLCAEKRLLQYNIPRNVLQEIQKKEEINIQQAFAVAQSAPYPAAQSATDSVYAQ